MWPGGGGYAGIGALLTTPASAVGAQGGAFACVRSLRRPGGHEWEAGGGTHTRKGHGLCARRRDRELAKFEAYLNKEECISINALVKGRSKLAYPIRR